MAMQIFKVISSLALTFIASNTAAQSPRLLADSIGIYPPAAILGAEGLPVIAYSTAGQKLMVSQCADPACNGFSSTLMDTAAIGQISMALGRDGNPIITYVRLVNGRPLSVIKCGNASCSSGNRRSILDSGSEYSSIGVGPDGIPAISYSHGNRIRMIRCGTPACDSGNSRADLAPSWTDGPIAGNSTIAVGPDNRPVIAKWYRDRSDRTQWIKCGNDACLESNFFRMLDSTTYWSTFAVAVPSDNVPLIAFQKDAGQGVRLIRCRTADCQGENTFSDFGTGTGGPFVSPPVVAFNAAGLPVILHSAQAAAGRTIALVSCLDPACQSRRPEFSVPNSMHTLFAGFLGKDGFPFLVLVRESTLWTLKCSAPACADLTPILRSPASGEPRTLLPGRYFRSGENSIDLRGRRIIDPRGR